MLRYTIMDAAEPTDKPSHIQQNWQDLAARMRWLLERSIEGCEWRCRDANVPDGNLPALTTEEIQQLSTAAQHLQFLEAQAASMDARMARDARGWGQ